MRPSRRVVCTAPPKTTLPNPHSNAVSASAGGGTRTPDTRIMICYQETGFGAKQPDPLASAGVGGGHICLGGDQVRDQISGLGWDRDSCLNVSIRRLGVAARTAQLGSKASRLLLADERVFEHGHATRAQTVIVARPFRPSFGEPPQALRGVEIFHTIAHVREVIADFETLLPDG